MKKYNIDEYSRYVEDEDGERFQVESYPWPREHPWLACVFALDVLRWHIGMIRQHGLRTWIELRRL